LEQPITLEEIKNVIFEANGRKAPGPDGIPFSFYQTFWETINTDLFHIIKAFENHSLELSKINHTIITLIPKTSDANTIQQYRPISLINCSCKVISKLLANRLTPIMDQLIDHSQTTFIKGRSIFDNIISAQEILFQVRKNKTKGILFKIDFEKAFDKVNWDYLNETLRLMIY
jgi:Reverse transcriptase (RNA-dependent DNA polymerase)